MKKVPDPLSGLENSNLTTKEDDKQEEDHRMWLVWWKNCFDPCALIGCRYVEGVLNYYYHGNGDVIRDMELQSWINEIIVFGHLGDEKKGLLNLVTAVYVWSEHPVVYLQVPRADLFTVRSPVDTCQRTCSPSGHLCCVLHTLTQNIAGFTFFSWFLFTFKS